MKPRGGLCVLLFFGGVLLMLGSTLAFLVVLRPGSDVGGCGGNSVQAGAVDIRQGVGDLSSAELGNVAGVITEGRRRNLPDQAIVVALAAANQESGFKNYANDGVGGDLAVDQRGIEQSLSLPHEAVGTDHGSLGVFQQQWPWWGKMRDLMDPSKAAGKFYDALVRVPGWSLLPVTVAAQRVQRSAYPSAYADDEGLARELLRGSSSTVSAQQAAAFSDNVPTGCVEATSGGTVRFPLPPGSTYVDLRNWGHRAAVWQHGHTGTDFSVRCGTPVLAATSGTVIVRTDQAWAGRWLVEVSTGRGELTTWYAHMQALLVTDGQHVDAGQQIGQGGDLGNSTGCHLHFEVHPHGGTIYQDNVNPSVWLSKNIGRSPGGAPGGRFVVATFNTLGASHTSAHGNKPWMASGTTRTRGLVSLLEQHHVDVAGLQEFQRTQYQAFRRLTRSTYGIWHPPGDTENAVIWRRSRFSFVDGRSFAIPYFDGHPRRMPIVRLTSRITGESLTVVNVHNPADTRRFPRQGHWRAVAIARELDVVNAQHDGNLIVTGDFNEKRAPFCRLAARARLVAAAGGRFEPRCRPPSNAGIDWILAAPSLRFSGYTADHSSQVRAASDHPFISATAR